MFIFNEIHGLLACGRKIYYYMSSKDIYVNNFHAPLITVSSIAAMLLTRLIATGTLLYQVNPRSPVAFMIAALVMITIALAACFTPAWHAARTDPVRALRE